MKLKPRDKKIIRFRVLDDKSREQIAEELGVVPITVSRAFKKEGAEEYAEKIETEREKRYLESYQKALDVAMDAVVGCVTELVRISKESENDRVRADACVKIAYMAGLKPVEAENTGKSKKLVIEEKPKKAVVSA